MFNPTLIKLRREQAGRNTLLSRRGAEQGELVYGNPFYFQGRVCDKETELYHFRPRWYDPETGRWLSPDPIGISGGVNLYLFCNNNPVNFVDPKGDFAFWGGIIGGVGTGLHFALRGESKKVPFFTFRPSFDFVGDSVSIVGSYYHPVILKLLMSIMPDQSEDR